MGFTAKPPVEKLPLAARKSIRDNFESKRPEYEQQISSILGQPWTIEVNANEVFPYASSGEATDPGSCFSGYFTPLVRNIKEFADKYGDDGKTEINTVVSNHKIILAVDDTEKHNYSGSDVKDGVLRILFHAEKLGMFPSDASNDIVGALKNAPAPAGSMSLATRNGIKTVYEAGVEEVRAAIAKLVAVPDLKLTPNFEFNYGVLSAMGDKAGSDWGPKLGQDTLGYFQGVKTSLEKQNFGNDDLLQEGFQEAINKNEITLKIVDKLDCGGSYNEVVIKDGVLIIQTLPDQWGSWMSDPANTLIDLL